MLCKSKESWEALSYCTNRKCLILFFYVFTWPGHLQVPDEKIIKQIIYNDFVNWWKAMKSNISIINIKWRFMIKRRDTHQRFDGRIVFCIIGWVMMIGGHSAWTACGLAGSVNSRRDQTYIRKHASHPDSTGKGWEGAGGRSGLRGWGGRSLLM